MNNVNAFNTLIKVNEKLHIIIHVCMDFRVYIYRENDRSLSPTKDSKLINAPFKILTYLEVKSYRERDTEKNVPSTGPLPTWFQ